jgi:subfamily B ATP-binding cassette protein MsbA
MDAASTAPEPDRVREPRADPPPASPARRGDAPEFRRPAAGPAGLRETARRLGRYARPHRASITGAVILFFASSAIDPLVPALFKWLLDNGFKADFGFPLWIVPGVIVGLFFVRGALGFGGAYLFARSTSNAVLALRSDLVRSVMRADASLHVHLSPGVVAARVINDPQNAINAVGGSITTVLRDGTTVIALLAYLFYLNWQLTLAALIIVPALAVVVRKVQKRVLAISGESYESQVRLIGIVDDIARGWRVVRTFDAGDFERRRFEGEANRLRRTTMKAIVAGATMTPLTQLVASSGVAVIVTLALADAHRGGTTVGDFVAFVTTLLMTISPMRHLTDVTQPIILGLVQARACFDLADTEPEHDPGQREIRASRGEVRFEHVSVRHPGADQPALVDVDLQIPAGQTVALVGPSGAGKTTLLNAMLGFVSPSAGRVLLDGTDIADFRKASLRRQFAVVSQDVVLFDGTIEDNVIYAQEPDPARVDACLKAADLETFVRTLPDGKRTRVGTNGNRLSGGQRQRLAIARALYKEASVWVFDEATSALDSTSERVVHGSIDRWRGERTLLLVAHRLSTVRHADCIHVFADGRIVESGRHEALMAADGLYAGMVRSQVLT